MSGADLAATMAGLVASSAAAAFLRPAAAILVGAVAGVLVVYSIDVLEFRLTIDDPGAYTKPWSTFKYFTLDNSGSWYQWACTVREVEGFTDRMAKPATTEPSAK